MMTLRKYIKHSIRLFSVAYLIFFSTFNTVSADELDWIEVAKINNQIQSIDANSIKYNSKGFLTVMTKYSEINPEDQEVINTNLYLMAVDCESRLFSKFQANAEIKQIKNWEEPTNNKLMKKTILNSCSY